MSDEEGQKSSETVLFSERQQALHCIATVTDETASKEARNDVLHKLRHIFDKYLECPTLLDPYLEEMVCLLASSARNRLESSEDNPFETTPCLPHALSALYALCKVRGYKRVRQFLPHEVRDVEPVLRALQRMDTAPSSQCMSESVPVPWESLYVLWVWMGMLSLVPFDHTVLSEDSFLPSLLGLAKAHLSHAGPTRDAASSCLASWLSRPDLKTDLVSFVDWSNDVLRSFETNKSHDRAFVVMGVMQTLAGLVKNTTDRTSNLVEMERLWEPTIVVAAGQAAQGAMLLRKLLVKWFSRMGCSYLPPKVAAWRYQRGRRSLLENLNASNRSQSFPSTEDEQSDGIHDHQEDLFHVPDQVEDAMGFVLQSLADPSTVVRWSAAKGVGRMTERLPSICADDVLDAILALFRDTEKDHAWHGACLALAELARRGLLLPSRLDDVVPLVVRAIQFDVRRGQTSVGSNPFVPELSRSLVIASLFDREVNCRRAASAAFQECVGRQGADNFKHGISILTAADYYSLGNIHNAYTVVAKHVAQYQEYQNPIISYLYTKQLYHWDPSIRSLSSKALNGIVRLDIDLAVEKVVPHLVNNSTEDNLFIRHGAVLGLAETILSLSSDSDGKDSLLNRINDETLASIADLVPTIERKRLYRGRGGESMRSAVCRLIECISLARIQLAVKQQVRLLDTVDACLKHPSEEIQVASSSALHSLMRSYFPVGTAGPSDRLQKRVVDKYIEIVSKSINPAETRGFSLALGVLPRKLLAPSSEVQSSVIDCLCNAARCDAKVGDEGDAETRRNAITALGRICNEVGIRSSHFSYPVAPLSHKQINQVFEALLLALDDYNIDRRGDVGSWSRIAAMSGIESLSYAVAKASQLHVDVASPDENPRDDQEDKENDALTSFVNVPHFSQELCIRIFGSLLKQLSEKLDAVRSHAGSCLERMLTNESPYIPHIPKKTVLCRALHLVQPRKMTNWSHGNETFKMVMAVADIDEFFYYVISGMVISIGGLGESVAKPAEEALLAWVKADGDENHAAPQRASRLADALLNLFHQHQRQRRVTLPLLKTIDILLNRGCLNAVALRQDASFSSSLLACLKIEANKCTDVHRLLAIVSVSLGILCSRAEDRKINEDILVFVLRMLGHSYPRVRRFTADHLYVRLLEEPEVVPCRESVDAAMELLLEGQWDADVSLENTRELRNRVAELFGVAMPVVASNRASPNAGHEATAKRQNRTDEFSSYASLVNDLS